MSDAAILVEDLGKRFGQIVAVDGVNLQVPPGTVLGLLGPNGAGKTTIVRIPTTILRPDSVRATVLGHDVAARPDTVRTSIGLAGQYAAVDGNLTGRENLRMVGRLTHQRKPLIAPGPTSSSNASGSPAPPTGRCGPIRAACAGASTWLPPWCTSPRCSSSTSRRPGSTPGAATISGR